MKRTLIAILILDAVITASWFLIPVPGENSLRGILLVLAGYMFAVMFVLSFPVQVAVVFLITYLELLAFVAAVRWILKRGHATKVN